MTSTPSTQPDTPPDGPTTTPPATDTPLRQGHPVRWLTACALLYTLTHHIGFGLAGLGTVGRTRWADWIDILTPYTVLLTAAATLHTAHAGRRTWALYLTGAFTYIEGHGIHLAANSVGNDAPGDVAHLWDEVTGHYLWYAGTALVIAALAAALAHRPAPPTHLTLLPALGVAFTWTSNSLEGGTAVMGLTIAIAFTTWGLHTRHHLGRVLIPAFAPAIVMLTGYGIWHHGFPQPTELGWV
ncbi:hypothetical protein BZB76_4220 [Actinomadura pelletieri DSM 43383]|uniref:Uncharacterized protein n=1 Tax=Actinomadura pelletieri DSM 43383 TaxID=1120940 RepID=A0A495QLS5_9ACTN|nr:hypothetical protein [Actinomadura pelletieri]RKS73527.1 hypothetical protein BZB76_4220 [Actinomadura pelletieri DSM 43383]